MSSTTWKYIHGGVDAIIAYYFARKAYEYILHKHKIRRSTDSFLKNKVMATGACLAISTIIPHMLGKGDTLRGALVLAGALAGGLHGHVLFSRNKNNFNSQRKISRNLGTFALLGAGALAYSTAAVYFGKKFMKYYIQKRLYEEGRSNLSRPPKLPLRYRVGFILTFPISFPAALGYGLNPY